jgi:Ribbon-helix-helix protein, copG family
MALNDEWEREEVETAKPVGIVISVRFSQSTAERIYAEAKRRGVSTSTMIRGAVESWLDTPIATSTIGDVSVSSANGAPVSFIEGRAAAMRTTGAAADIELATS